jgi:hypothetical protein
LNPSPPPRPHTHLVHHRLHVLRQLLPVAADKLGNLLAARLHLLREQPHRAAAAAVAVAAAAVDAAAARDADALGDARRDLEALLAQALAELADVVLCADALLLY